jgi:hypothetical protein
MVITSRLEVVDSLRIKARVSVCYIIYGASAVLVPSPYIVARVPNFVIVIGTRLSFTPLARARLGLSDHQCPDS